MTTPEKLNLWDRLFNRERREVAARGVEQWVSYRYGVAISGSEFTRNYVDYRVVDRVTGSERIVREYLN